MRIQLPAQSEPIATMPWDQFLWAGGMLAIGFTLLWGVLGRAGRSSWADFAWAVAIGVRVVRPLRLTGHGQAKQEGHEEGGAVVVEKRRGHGKKSTREAVCFIGRDARGLQGHGRAGSRAVPPAP